MKYLIALMAASALMAGCVQKPANEDRGESASTQSEEAAPTRVVRERQPERSAPATTQRASQPPRLNDPSRQLPELQGELDSQGAGLGMIIDGSSPDAFLQSLEIIAGETSTQQYHTFHSALQYLHAYSLDRSNLSAFYQTLDGRTAEEVIELAARRRVQRGR